VASDANVIKGLTTIADFKLSEDVLDLKTNLNGALSAVQLGQADLDNIADTTVNDTLIKAVQAAITLIDAGGDEVTVFNWKGDSYVVVDNGVAGTFDANDGLIKLTGLADANLFNVDGTNLLV